MPTRNVSLSGHYDSFIESNVKSGRFDNASEVFRAGLRLLEQQQEENDLKLENLRQAAKLGFDQLERDQKIKVSGDELEDYITGLGSKASEKLNQS